MIKTTDWKTLIFILLVAFTYTKCASFKEIQSRSGLKLEKSKLDKESRFRKDVVAYAKNYLGKPYKYAGRSPKGFDCSGFTKYVYQHFSVQLSPSSSAQETEGKSIKVEDAKAGDLIFFRRSKKGRVFHVALVVSNDKEGLKAIHSTSRGVVIDNLTASKYWKPKISTARDVVVTEFK